ncbi:DMT family transporter [Ferruginivarius sediminum]|uniref:DMT family transporter n=1 Tax=Ferruginivarius sediminum TaxID=2661937 RepID=A0A369TFD4_9PROT|nr:DMT family transporter [Ferruginivarius sediminum]RDD63304.1 DMT family transporter [Ferruginivarius sediminum]
MSPRHLLAVVIIMAMFGSAFAVGKLGVDNIPPFAFAALRSAILAVALLPLWRLRLPPRESLLPFAGFCAAMGTGVYATMYLALKLTSSVSPIIIGTQLSVPFAVLLGRVVLREPVRLVTWLAIAAAFGGVVVIAFDPALFSDLPALGVIALSAFCYALATMLARSLRHVGPFEMNGWMALSAVPALALLSAFTETRQIAAIRHAGLFEWAIVLHAALVVSLIGHVWMFSLYRHYPVAKVIPYYVLMPVFGIGLTLIIFAETPTLQTLVGGAIVLVSTYAVNRTTTRDRETQVKPAPPAPEGCEADSAPRQARTGESAPDRPAASG